MTQFAYPWVLWLLLLLPGLMWVRLHFYKQPTFLFPTLVPFLSLRSSRAIWAMRVAMGLRFLAFAALIVALARPQAVHIRPQSASQGIEMILVLDTSDSMAAEDFQPQDRLAVAKSVLADFVKKRNHDRMGLVVFGDYAVTLCPLTMDHAILLQQIGSVRLEMAGGRTAIGMGLVAALNRLSQGKAKSRVVVLLTDGDNTAGDVGPHQAAGLARDVGVKVYTVGIGKKGGAPVPIRDAQQGKVYAKNPDGSVYMTQMNEAPLKDMANLTGGRYFRAQDMAELAHIYATIDTLEKSQLDASQKLEKHERFSEALYIAIGLLLVEWVVLMSLGRVRL